MAIVYDWRCSACGHQMAVERASMKDSHVPPDSCERCTNTKEFEKLISRQGRPVLKGEGWHRDEYSKYRSIK